MHWITSNVGIKSPTAEETTPSSPEDIDGSNDSKGLHITEKDLFSMSAVNDMLRST